MEANGSATSPGTGFPGNTFTAWDYVVFAGLLGISTVIGLYYAYKGRKEASTSEFLMAGRSMGILPVALSLLASFMSSITMLGTASEIVVFGTLYWMICFAYCFVIPAAAYIFVPIFYELKVTSVFEYLEKRFSKGVRTYTCIVYVIQTVLYLALVLYAPCLALSVVTGLNKWIAVFSVGVVCTFYTTIGGMKAVMWTDVVQIFLMFAGLIGILVKGSIDHGGFANIWSLLYDNDRIEFWNPDPNPLTRHSIWSLVIGGTFTWLAIYGVNQAQIQRALCTPTCRQGQIAMWINLPGLTLLLTICALCGMIVFAEYHQCDPIRVGRIQQRDQLLPLYVMDKMFYPGFPGFFTACIFSGALSTISSGLNSLAAVVLKDLMLGICCKNMTDKRATLASKILSVVFGAIMIALTFVAAELGGLLQAALGIFGMIGGPVLGIFLLGIFYPWANYKGAYFGLTTGLVLTIWLGVGAQIYKPPIRGHVPAPLSMSQCPNRTYPASSFNTSLTTQIMDTYTAGNTFPVITEQLPPEMQSGYLDFYQMSYMWYSAFAVFVSSMSGLVVSFLTGYTRPSEVDPVLLSPFLDVVSWFLPEKWRLRQEKSKLKLNKVDVNGKLDDTPSEFNSNIESGGYINYVAYTGMNGDDFRQHPTGSDEKITPM